MKKNSGGSIGLFFILSIIVIGVILSGYYLMPQVYLKGGKVIKINYKELYKEPGFKAKAFTKDVTKKVKVESNVNSDKLGTYKVIYTIPGIIDKKVTRTVIVLDKSKPVFKFTNKEDIYLCPGKKFQGEEVTAFDNYDGDLTKKIVVEEKKDSVIYKVKDSSGNERVYTKKIIYRDNENPVLTLNGSKNTYAFINEEYKEAGYSASDNCDGDITNNVKVDSGVNLKQAGTYTINYSVTDKGGNTVSDKRTVVVSERGRVGTVYLTFDDGPQEGTTNVILDILKEEGVEATFFVTNKGPDYLIKRIYDEGHTVALHTATHDYAIVYASVDSYFNDLNTVNERVKRITGSYSYIIRFPGGASNTVSRRYSPGIMTTLTQQVVSKGYRYYDWNISSGDAAGGSPTPANIRDNVIYSLRHDRVNMVLMHDIKTYTRDALRDIIRYGKENGYTFEKITSSTEMVTQRVNN